MGVAKAGRDTAVKAKAAPAVNGAFHRRVDHGGGRKVGGDGRATEDNRQQWQQQSGNNQLQVTVASGGIDSRGCRSKQQRSRAIVSETSIVKANVVVPATPLSLLSAGSGGQAAAAAARE